MIKKIFLVILTIVGMLFLLCLNINKLKPLVFTPRQNINKSNIVNTDTILIDKIDIEIIATNNTDGRGTPHENDDIILKVNPDIFFN